MNSEHERTHIERAERWAAMEWILVGGRRWWLLAFLLLMTAASTAVGILYAESVGQLRPNEFRTFVRQQEEEPENFGPLFRRVHNRKPSEE